MAELKVKVPIRFSKRAQRELYETCMAYKELAEVRGAENKRLRELVRDMFLVVACMDLDGSQLHTHGVDADWRTLRERYDELMGYEGEVDG